MKDNKKEQNYTKKGKLILEDGTEFIGNIFGYQNSVSGEVVFNTGMVGYPETLTDPSYTGQLLTLTYPLIGNYGIPTNLIKNNIDQNFESSKVHIQALILSELAFVHNHWNAVQSLSDWLEVNKVPGIFGIDTRQLTKILRERGTMLGKLIVDEHEVELYDPNKDDLISKVCPDKPETLGNGKKKILLIDCGSKNSIIQDVLDRDTTVIRVPWNYDFENLEFDGVLLSNGPGNPEQYQELIDKIKKLLTKNKPILGICLGHQMIACAAGAKTYKLKYGHRGQNQPVKITDGHKCFVTSQNHGYAVDESTIPGDWEPWFVNLNDNTNEGIRHKSLPIRSVQFHPEAAPGPTDTSFIFDEFINEIK